MTLHRYVSTACWHDKHPGCRVVCKFCNQICLCRCHWDGPADERTQTIYDMEMARRFPDKAAT